MQFAQRLPSQVETKGSRSTLNGQPISGVARRRALRAFGRALSARADPFLPGQPPYEALVTPWNHRYASVRPTAILVPGVVSDVQQAVICARSAGPPRSVVGYNTAGYSTTTGLLIIMARFNAVTWSPSQSGSAVPVGTAQIFYGAGTVTVGAGAVVGDLSPGLAADGYLIPTGRCPGVGIAGLSWVEALALTTSCLA